MKIRETPRAPRSSTESVCALRWRENGWGNLELRVFSFDTAFFFSMASTIDGKDNPQTDCYKINAVYIYGKRRMRAYIQITPFSIARIYGPWSFSLSISVYLISSVSGKKLTHANQYALKMGARLRSPLPFTDFPVFIFQVLSFTENVSLSSDTERSPA